MNIYVGNLSFDTGDAELRDEFSKYGTVTAARVIEDKYTGRSRGFAFVEMADASEGQKAIAELNGKNFGGRTLTVNEARPREDRPRGGGGGGGYGGGGGGYR